MNDIQFWKDLCPNLTITETDHWVLPSKANAEDLSERILKDGYFHIQFDSWNLPLDEMARCIEKLKELNMQPVWCFMYDEFWLLTTKIHEHIKSILGENYSKLPAIWAWHIDPSKQERGWKIHREGYPNSVFDDGMPKTLTVWIALSDATSENGCICVVPIKDDPNFNITDGKLFHEYQPEYFYDNSKIILEAKAGDVLGWHPQLLHWGKASTNKNATPRMSISVEFISDRAIQMDDSAFLYSIDENPCIHPFYIPNQAKKIELINMLISQYKHMWETKDD